MRTIRRVRWFFSGRRRKAKGTRGFHVGVRKSAQSWRELFVDLKAHGLAIAPEVAVGDGALGFWKAIEESSP
ncbi:transposase [Stappia sp. 22II-S9-Z10]|nr:transposase [Stappia sp. 22II-S9-Z10]